MSDEERKLDSLQTNDMAMVSFLRMNGHTPTKIEIDDRGICHWHFSGDGVFDLGNDFIEDRALVNPRRFTKFYAITKREMFTSQSHKTT